MQPKLHLTTAVDVVIPARNEALTLGPIIEAFHGAVNIGKVIVVDDQSTDNTWGVASEYGAMCTRGMGEGKGQAIHEGLQLVTTEHVVLCDGDIKGFTEAHADIMMVDPGPECMVVGVLEFSPNVPWAHKIKDTRIWEAVSGQRHLPTALIRDLPLHGYAMEVQINAAVARAGYIVQYRKLNGARGTVKPLSYDRRVKEWMRDLEWLREHGV